MDCATQVDDQWTTAETNAHAELSRLFRKWRQEKPYGDFGVCVTTEGARGPQFVTPFEEPKKKI